MVGSQCHEGGVPNACKCTYGCVWEGNVWVGLLESQECEQPLEYGVDDQEWIHLLEELGYVCYVSLLMSLEISL